MEEAISDMTYLFYKTIDWLFYGANIRPGLSVGYIIMAAAIIGIVIGTLAPRPIDKIIPDKTKAEMQLSYELHKNTKEWNGDK